MEIRAAISPCPNDIFIFSGLMTGNVMEPNDPKFTFTFQDLEMLNQDAQVGKWDLVKISYANYAACANTYQLLRCGGALGRRCGPLLLSNQKRWDPSEPVLVPGQATTANFLLDYFYPKGLRKIYLPFDELYQRLLGSEKCQGVVIHEMRFTYQADGLVLIRDLGENWEAKTGFPIPLGAVALRKTKMEPLANSLWVQKIEAMIRRSLSWAYSHEPEAMSLCKQYSQSLSDSVLKAHIDLYVNDFSHDLGLGGDSAVAYFLDHQNRS